MGNRSCHGQVSMTGNNKFSESHKFKFMGSVFWDSTGAIHIYFLPYGITINPEYYNNLHEIIWWKSWETKIILLYDDAHPHMGIWQRKHWQQWARKSWTTLLTALTWMPVIFICLCQWRCTQEGRNFKLMTNSARCPELATQWRISSMLLTSVTCKDDAKPMLCQGRISWKGASLVVRACIVSWLKKTCSTQPSTTLMEGNLHARCSGISWMKRNFHLTMHKT